MLSSALQGVAAKLAPKFTGPYTIAAQLGPNVYEVVDQDGKPAGKIHVEDLKPFHERTASEEDSEEEHAEASTPEVSEEHDASTKRHSANARIPETEAHPHKRGRPRKARLVVEQTAQKFTVDKRVSNHWSRTALTSDHRNPVPVAMPHPYPDHAGDPQVRETPPRLLARQRTLLGT